MYTVYLHGTLSLPGTIKGVSQTHLIKFNKKCLFEIFNLKSYRPAAKLENASLISSWIEFQEQIQINK